MNATAPHLQWHLGLVKIRLPTAKMHNLTYAIGLVVCMSAGVLTVVQETFPDRKTETHRIFRTARRASKKTKDYFNDLWN